MKWKTCSSSSFVGDSCLLSLCMLVWNKFSYEGGHSITHSIFRTSVQRRKDHFSLFPNTKQVVKVAKMLIKLILVDSNHVKRYKCKIMHYLDSQTLSEYISTIVLDDNQKLSINEVLEVLIGVGKVYPRRFVTFYFLLGSSIQCLLSVGIRSYFIQRNICMKTGKCIYS